jgi:GTP cyclohydrolase IA
METTDRVRVDETGDGDAEVLSIRGGLIPGGAGQSTDPEDTPWEQVSPRPIPAADWERFEGYMGEIFGAFGMDLDTDATRDTPRRFLKAIYDATSGYEGDEKLLTAFPAECGRNGECDFNQVIEGRISFHALCEHHVLPFYGFAYVGYIPHERIIGISKLTRLVRLFARRFTVQEWMGRQIADALVDLMDPHGVAVYLEASHLCTQMRGVREEQARTVTTFWRGTYDDSSDMRREFLQTIRASEGWS